MEKAGIDVVPRLITATINSVNAAANVNKFTFSASLDAKLAFNPVHYFYTTATTNLGVYKTQYKEWRMKQCKVHIMFENLSTVPLAQWTLG